MRVQIKGKSKSLSERIIREALWFYADCLTKPRDYKKLNISLKFSRPLVPTQAHVYTPNKKRFRMVASARSGPYQLLQNLAHEMLHVQQYLDGKMTENRAGTAWKGRIYKGDFHKDTDAYFNAPWEVDANGRAYWLYKRCRIHLLRCGFKLRR